MKWKWLYKNLATRTHVFTWGSNSKGNLGHAFRSGRPPRPTGPFRSTGWPTKMCLPQTDKLGTIADVQCGGWSTGLLNSRGQIYAVGILNGERQQASIVSLTPMAFPPGYPATDSQRYDPSTAIQQFSLGRSRMLGLSDTGLIWEWTDFNHPAHFIRFFNLDTISGGGSSNGPGRVTKVIAGWSRSSAYVNGIGIVYWTAKPSHNTSEPTDGFLLSHGTVPGTAFRRRREDDFPKDSLDFATGEVTTYIVLENYIIFITHSNKLYAWPINQQSQPLTTAVELTSFYQHIRDDKMQDLQGSFRNFGVFTKGGSVVTGTQALLDSWCARSHPQPIVSAALQDANVISLAFGDWHSHALHTDGTVTSHGHEPDACGCLGMGGAELSKLRGVLYNNGRTGDGVFAALPPAWRKAANKSKQSSSAVVEATHGRRTIWFEPEKEIWLGETCQKAATSEAQVRAAGANRASRDVAWLGEWFEHHGRTWQDGPDGYVADDNSENTVDDGIGSHFVLKVAAAGWSSAALVLVDEEKAERVRSKYLAQPVPEQVHAESSSEGEKELLKEKKAPREQDPSRGMGSGFSKSLGSFKRRLMRSEKSTNGNGSVSNNGPPTTATATAASSTTSSSPKKKEKDIWDDTYVWNDQPFPRLRFPDGTLMRGEVPETPWKGGRPD